MSVVSDLQSPEEIASTKELARLLERAVDELPDGARVVFMMREIQQLSTAETAECLQISEEAVKVRLHRAKAILRESMFTRLESAAEGAFEFLGARCDRIVERVLSRLGS
jgi:RNA polymerase sigma-70 factor (ECF subfamily)